MEFKLPFPTLQDLAVLKIVHSLMEVCHDSLVINRVNSLKKVDKLALPKKQKCIIREFLKGTHDHLQDWYRSRSLILCATYNGRPKLQFDVHGCVDEVRMARVHLQKCYLDERLDNDFNALEHLLRVASYYVLLPDIHEILPKILKFLAGHIVIPLLERPEFEIHRDDDRLHLVYRFVDQQGTPMLLNVDYFNDCPPFSAVCVSNTCVSITLNLIFYNSEMCQLHWNLLEPAKRIPFVRNVIRKFFFYNLNRQVVDILHFLDLDSRKCILGEIHSQLDSYVILRSLLVWPYQEFFPPALQMIRSQRELQHYKFINLFQIIFSKLDMVAFEELLLPFWEAISSEVKSDLSHIISFNCMLRELACKNVPMYKRISVDLNLPLAYLPESRKRKYDESSSSNSNV